MFYPNVSSKFKWPWSSFRVVLTDVNVVSLHGPSICRVLRRHLKSKPLYVIDAINTVQTETHCSRVRASGFGNQRRSQCGGSLGLRAGNSPLFCRRANLTAEEAFETD